MARPEKRAFTLVELMVVVAIIPLLAAVLLLSLSRVFHVQRTIHCINHLHKIAQAHATRKADEKLCHLPRFAPAGWPGALLPYLGQDATALICPESDGVLRPPISEQFRVRFYGSSYDYNVVLGGPYALMLSDSQYHACKSAGYVRHGKELLKCPCYPGYEPDGNPDVVWFCMEELQPGSAHLQAGSPARDFEDVRMRITDNHDGTIGLYFELGSGKLDAQVVRVDGGEVLATIPKGHPRAARGAGPFPGGLTAKCSYGMNAAILAPGLRKVLVLDYEWLVAKSVDVWTDPRLDEDLDGVPNFARHAGRINVGFMDGSVKTKWPQEIDPIVPSVARRHWQADR